MFLESSEGSAVLMNTQLKRQKLRSKRETELSKVQNFTLRQERGRGERDRNYWDTRNSFVVFVAKLRLLLQETLIEILDLGIHADLLESLESLKARLGKNLPRAFATGASRRDEMETNGAASSQRETRSIFARVPANVARIDSTIDPRSRKRQRGGRWGGKEGAVRTVGGGRARNGSRWFIRSRILLPDGDNNR